MIPYFKSKSFPISELEFYTKVVSYSSCIHNLWSQILNQSGFRFKVYSKFVIPDFTHKWFPIQAVSTICDPGFKTKMVSDSSSIKNLIWSGLDKIDLKIYTI